MAELNARIFLYDMHKRLLVGFSAKFDPGIVYFKENMGFCNLLFTYNLTLINFL